GYGNGDTLSVNTGNLNSTDTFSILATDTTLGCSSVLTPAITITVLTPDTLQANATGYICGSPATGTINLSVSGSYIPYSFLWSNADTAQNPQSLATGSYIVTVTNVYGCTSSATAGISCTPVCSMDSLIITCSKCLPVDSSGNQHFWSISFNYSGSNYSSIQVSSVHNSVHGAVNSTVSTGNNTNLVMGQNMFAQGYTTDTMLITVVDAITGDTCYTPIPINLVCDSADYLPNCSLSVIELGSSHAYDQGVDYSGHHLYMGTFVVNNHTGNGIGGTPVQCPDCFQYYGGGNFFPPGTTVDTMYFSLNDSTQTTVRMTFAAFDQTLCGICSQPLYFFIQPTGTPCSIDSLTGVCQKIEPQSGSLLSLWSLSFNYTGSNGSNMFVTPLHSSLRINTLNSVNSGRNTDLVIASVMASQPYALDTLLVTIVDPITGDTCRLPVAVSLANDSSLYLQSCSSGVIAASSPQVYCQGIDPNSGLPQYTAVFPITNYSTQPFLGGVLACPDCHSINDNGGQFAPGVNMETVQFEPDSLNQNSIHLTFGVVDTSFCPLCKIPYPITIPLCAPLQVISGDTLLCAGSSSCYRVNVDSTMQVSYQILSGGASIDSITGCVSNATGNFTIRAVAMDSIGNTAFKDLAVTVHTSPTATPTNSGPYCSY